MKSKSLPLLLGAILSLGLGGCATWYNSSRHEANSVVQFLYPDQSQPFIQPQIPTLRLPLRVGVAFVPPAPSKGQAWRAPEMISETQKALLLRRVAAEFKALPFVQSIEIVPTTYLRPGGGFDNLDQLHGLMGIDVVALVSYDQAQNTSDTPWSLSYWTIVGAYFVPAQKNDTHTLMEAVVYDIPSRSLLFRAPGVSMVNGHSTPIRTDAELRADSARSLDEAAKDLTVNLQQELELFKVRAKEEPQSIHIEHKPGYTGGGALDGWFAALLVLLLAGRFACPLICRSLLAGDSKRPTAGHLPNRL
ncbi:rhombotarget lipoprotein [Opitutus sp. GAS368]|jgi:rhombotail lipoprotein|uniref:rhombotarget lipoprotein n=1 Tax=Opitutus sp. GAS368 TaxID=1882749 RepID=UPI00087CBE90|nr:rhombotarget lipoprotein [Opitutus sp. GAS368]SDR91336.1 rhombotail lipoprotein [Opitutus sp. GAS368]